MAPIRSYRPLRGIELRFVLVDLLHHRGGPLAVPDLVEELTAAGFDLGRGHPGKVVADALRWELPKGRVGRAGRGRYVAGTMPRGTRHWIGVEAARARAAVASDVTPLAEPPRGSGHLSA